ncbi:hypothetical protein EYF80_024178 [Liparis tanakae]|uniref:Uncharacterized protein n=1 Tax=Liparis tanakae TaxID=230148 RepID=A0A4Z2HIA8_9TELE|nr:hypothetical protein EYF80_024178 [Liparis tanakae]
MSDSCEHVVYFVGMTEVCPLAVNYENTTGVTGESRLEQAAGSGWSNTNTHSKGAVSLDDAPHHADLLRPEELQRQRLTRHQHHGCVWQHGDGLTAVLIVDRTAVKLLHV